VLRKGIENAGYEKPTLIQEKTLQVSLEQGQDVIGAAETVRNSNQILYAVVLNVSVKC
jgi:superfamily II DNA/RNA helicase